jgi:gamma-tubulin complex component 3
MGELQLIVDIRNQMQHFITNLQYYVMFEVLEASWRQLETDMAAAAHLDALLDAHAKYVQTIVDRSMLSETASLLHHQVLVHTPDISTHKPAVPSHICAGVGPHLRRNRLTSAPGLGHICFRSTESSM